MLEVLRAVIGPTPEFRKDPLHFSATDGVQAAGLIGPKRRQNQEARKFVFRPGQKPLHTHRI